MAAALTAEGYSVWWDRHLAGGDEFSAEIEKELSAAKAVIVAWSVDGSKSRWVKDEAGIAAGAGKLVAVSLDGSEPPIGFKQFHAIDFGDASDAVFAEVKRSVGLKINPAAGPKTEATVLTATSAKPSQGDSRKKLAIAAAVTIAALFAGIIVIRGLQNPATPAGEITPEIAAADAQQSTGDYRSIAVLAFTDLSPQGDQEYFSDGIAEELLNVLARDTTLRVAARTSSFAFKGKEQSIGVIGKALNVDAVLEGSVRKAGDQLRITAQLIDVQSGFHLWSQTYDRELTDVFAIQDEIAQAIVGSLPSSGASHKVTAVRQTNREAYDLYLQGRHHLMRRTRPSIERANALFERSVAIDPTYAPAWAELAMSTLLLRRGPGTYGNLDLSEVIAIAGPEIDKALTLDPALAEAHVASGLFKVNKGDSRGALTAYRRAIELNPSTPNARHLLYITLLRNGEFREAFEVIDEAAAFDPLSGIISENHVASLIRRGQTEDAINAAQRLIDLHPDWPLAKLALAYAYNDNRQFAEAARLLDEAATAARSSNLNLQAAFQFITIKFFDHTLVENAPVHPASFLAVIEGRHEQARDLVMELNARDPNDPFNAGRTGWTLWAIGDATGALEVFENSMKLPGVEASLVTRGGCYPGLYVAGLYQYFGDSAAAQPIIDRCRETLANMAAQGYVLPFSERDMPVELLMVEGRYDEALAELRKLADSDQFISWWIEFEPNYRPLYDDPRFQQIVADLNARAEREREKYLAAQ